MPTMARGAVLRAFNEPLTLEEAPVPDPEPGALVARIDLAGICGTDVHLHHGNLPIPTPVILGHEAVGRVEKLGAGVTADFNGEPLQEGDAIAWASSIPCGRATGASWRRSAPSAKTAKSMASTSASTRGRASPVAGRSPSTCNPARPSSSCRPASPPSRRLPWAAPGRPPCTACMEIGGIGVGETVVVQGSGPVGLAAAMYAQLGGRGENDHRWRAGEPPRAGAGDRRGRRPHRHLRHPRPGGAQAQVLAGDAGRPRRRRGP